MRSCVLHVELKLIVIAQSVKVSPAIWPRLYEEISERERTKCAPFCWILPTLISGQTRILPSY